MKAEVMNLQWQHWTWQCFTARQQTRPQEYELI